MTHTDTDHHALFNTDTDARRLRRIGLACYGLLYGHVFVCMAGALPSWTLALSAPILVVRWMLSTHELFHLRRHDEVDIVTRLMPLLLTPFSLGYKEFQAIHRGHHEYMATPQDPEYFQIRGRPLAGFLNALTAPEQAFVRWLAREPVDAELVIGATCRLVLFAALLGLAGPVFVWYWLPTRLAFGASYFAFFYCEHRRGAEYGVYPMRLTAFQRRLFTVLFGREAMLATCYHHTHHHQPRVSAFRLPEVAEASDDETRPGPI